MIVDLHCHSDCSDGSLSPEALVKMAEDSKIAILSITDHDNIDAYQRIAISQSSVKIIPGIEFSTVWNKIGVHIVGLNINLESAQLLSTIKHQKQARKNRAKAISKKLEKYGLINAYEIIKLHSKPHQIGRPNFAKLLLEQGVAKDWKHAFNKFLGAGKAGDVKNNWLDFETIIKSILEAGGIPVLAHPLYYRLTSSKLKRLIRTFKRHGGIGMEVLNGFQNPEKTEYLGKLCAEYNLMASIGSDFHAPGKWRKLGCRVDTVKSIPSVWELF